MKIAVFAPNVGLDRIGFLPELELGAVLRFRAVVASAGGKGVNVARAARAFGVPTVVVGLLGGWIGRLIVELASSEGLDLRPSWIDGETRVNTVVLEDNGRVTVLNDPGPELRPEFGRALLEDLVPELEGSDLLVVTGSLPPGLAPALYGDAVRVGRASGRPVIVDATGEALRVALRDNPDIVTPNVFEAESALGWSTAELVTAERRELKRRAVAAARALVVGCRRAAIVKAGAAGAAVATAGSVWFVPAPEVHVCNPIGAGDAFVAGLAVGLLRHWPLVEAVRLAVAAGSASVETVQPGALDRRRVEELFALVAARAPELS
ncbi:MAG: hexose kinase [Thermomicrobium sp.]|nr:hexose kinase [Thermomicrobium sp.]